MGERSKGMDAARDLPTDETEEESIEIANLLWDYGEALWRGDRDARSVILANCSSKHIRSIVEKELVMVEFAARITAPRISSSN